jgi:hypothetical protein
MSDLYDEDILTWSERQAELLRRLAACERVNDQVDWENVVEEVESVGRSELHRTEALLTQALRHRLKIMAWPNSPEVPHWQDAATLFQMDGARVAGIDAAAPRSDADLPARPSPLPTADRWPTAFAVA